MTLRSQSDSFGQMLSTKSGPSDDQATDYRRPSSSKKREGKSTAALDDKKSVVQLNPLPHSTSLIAVEPRLDDAHVGSDSEGSKLANSDAKGAGVVAGQMADSSTGLNEASAANEASGAQEGKTPQPGLSDNDGLDFAKMLSLGGEPGDSDSKYSKSQDESVRASTLIQDPMGTLQEDGGRSVSSAVTLTSVEVTGPALESDSLFGSKLISEIGRATGPEANQGLALKGDGIKSLSPTKDRSSSAEARGKRKPDGAESEVGGDSTPLSRPVEKGSVESPHKGEDIRSQLDHSDLLVQQMPQSVDSTDKGSKPLEVQQPNTNTAAPTSSGLPQAPSSGSEALEARSALSSAQLIHSIRHSEMRLGMNSAEFGNLSISTFLTHQSLSAQISTEHLELGRALAIHLPAMEERLGTTYGLHTRLEVHDGRTASYGDSTQRQGGDARRQESSSSSTSVFPHAIGIGIVTPPVAGNTARLDIRI